MKVISASQVESTGKMHKKSSSETLKAWLLNRRSNPYPTPAEKAELMLQTGLNRSQLDHWFTNARQRYVRPKSRRGPNPNYSRYPQGVTKILVDWLTQPENVNHPYPSVEAQAELMSKTNLTKRQLQNWFTNARKRRLASRVMKQKTCGKEETPRNSTPDEKTVERKKLLASKPRQAEKRPLDTSDLEATQLSRKRFCLTTQAQPQSPSKSISEPLNLANLFCKPLPNTIIEQSDIEQQLQRKQQDVLLQGMTNKYISEAVKQYNQNLIMAATLGACNSVPSPASFQSSTNLPLMLNTSISSMLLPSQMKNFRQDSPRDVFEIESIQRSTSLGGAPEHEAAAMMLNLVGKV